MQFFQDFDPEDQSNSDTPISLMEKGMIMAILLLATFAVRKAKKAQTYGDLYKIMNRIQSKFESVEEKYEKAKSGDETSDAEKQEIAQEMIKDMTSVAESLN